MTSILRLNRWILSFADLCLLLLALMALMNIRAHREQSTEASSSELFVENIITAKIPADELFEEQQAMISNAGKSTLESIDFDQEIELSIVGKGYASSRMEKWEMAAARLASLKRYIQRNNKNAIVTLIGPELDNEAKRQHIIIKKPQSIKK